MRRRREALWEGMKQRQRGDAGAGGQRGRAGSGLGGGRVRSQGVADAETFLLVGFEHVGEAEALAADVAGVGLLARVGPAVPLHVGAAGEALPADLADVGLLACVGEGGARVEKEAIIQPRPCHPAPRRYPIPQARSSLSPVCVFMCSSKYCFMLKSLPHHWHMNCLCPMWMLMWERSWYLYWKRSLQFCRARTSGR